MTTPNPLQRYAATQTVNDAELQQIMREAANQAESIIMNKMLSEVDRAQIAIVERELRAMQSKLWGKVKGNTQASIARAAMQAAEAENLINRIFFNAIGGPIPELERAMQVRAQVLARTYQARMDNGISLSAQIYKTQALSNGIVDKVLNTGLTLGLSQRQIAERVRHLFSPSVPGGVSYAADRLARTEINNAFHRVQIDQRADCPFTIGFKWHLSGSHPKPDACNDYAERSHFKGGDAGVFRVEDVPGKPHPNCLCFLTSVQKDDQQLLDEFLDGKYNTYIDKQVYQYAPHVSPCG